MDKLDLAIDIARVILVFLAVCLIIRLAYLTLKVHSEKHSKEAGWLIPLFSFGSRASTSSESPSKLYGIQIEPGETVTLKTKAGYTGCLHITGGSAKSEGEEFIVGDILDVGLSVEDIAEAQEKIIEAGAQGLEAMWFEILLEEPRARQVK
ncbi:hypothetical protein [Microbulbifer aggregans]|uniref:hypothetical protein n=1 Tax=Microbulbifer aggregans TaxID=1769779 RepID=UPI001CFCB094|nr:hypothetical protein [Microbulbifer aggregans]